MASTPADAVPFPILAVENIHHWYNVGGREARPNGLDEREVTLASITWWSDGHSTFAIDVPSAPQGAATVNDDLEIIRDLYLNHTVGDLGCYWCDNRSDGEFHVTSTTRIEFKYARIKFRELFDFYTSADGVLRLPNWSHIQYAFDEFLTEDPRTKYHPSRVQCFINENGIDNLEMMD